MGDKEKKKDGEGESSAPIIEDERWEYLFNYVAKSLKIKMEKWNKMMIIDDYKVCIFTIPKQMITQWRAVRFLTQKVVTFRNILK